MGAGASVDGTAEEEAQRRNTIPMVRGKGGNVNPLDSLAPFSLQRSVNVEIKLRKDLIATDSSEEQKEYAMKFEVTGPQPVIDACTALSLHADGHVSPVSPITLQVDNKEWRARAGIPEEATHFAFVYPMEGTEKLTDALIWSVEKLEAAVEEGDAADDGPIPVPAQLELAYELLGTMTEGDWTFLCFGGYAYFDADENILQVNAIAQGDALHFNGPFPLTQDVLKKLDKGERLQPVTLSPIRSTGATRFCWIYPNELASFGIECKHGAFAYEYPVEEDGTSKSRYFHVISKQHALELEAEKRAAAEEGATAAPAEAAAES